MPNDVDTLMEMGFSKTRAEKALAKTNYKGVQEAMEWLFAHEADPDIDDPYEPPKGQTLGSAEDAPTEESMETDQSEDTAAQQPTETGQGSGDSGAATEEEPQQARSLKCEDCGKLLRSHIEAEAHAMKTQHQNFSESSEEIKPLTEEEKKAQIEKLQERLKQRRLEKEEQERKEQLQREKQRRLQGKELVNTKQKFQELEMKKIAEERRRDKIEEKLARQKVKEQIEKDKKERAAKFAKAQPTPAVPPPAAAAEPPKEAVKKDYDQCRIQIRLTNGNALTQNFSAKEPLSAVRLYVQTNRTDGDGPFEMMTTFPRKVFNEEDMEKPLNILGLVPSAVIMVKKA